MTWKFTMWLLEPRNLKLNANHIDTDEGKATCLPKQEEGGITFFTLNSSNATTAKNLKDHHIQHSHFK